jgi:hypothetical protein
MGGEQGVFLGGRPAEQVEGLETWHGIQVGLTVLPDADKLVLFAEGDAETIHGDEHGVPQRLQ